MHSKILKKQPKENNKFCLMNFGFPPTVLKSYYVKTNIYVIAGIRKVKQL